MDIVEAIAKVLVVGLIFGAGLPALFAVGIRLHAEGAAHTDADGTVTQGNPAYRAFSYVLFALVTLIIVVALLFLTRTTIAYYTGVQLFPFASS